MSLYLFLVKPGKPQNVKMTGTSNIDNARLSISFQWGAPFNGHASITQYQLQVYDDVTRSTQFTNANTTEASLQSGQSLVNNRNYTLRLRAQNMAGYGELSEPLQFITKVPGKAHTFPITNNLRYFFFFQFPISYF